MYFQPIGFYRTNEMLLLFEKLFSAPGKIQLIFHYTNQVYTMMACNYIMKRLKVWVRNCE